MFYIPTKLHKNIIKGIRLAERTLNQCIITVKTKEIMPNVRKPELYFLYVTCPLVLFYISSKYHQNISKGFWVTERTRTLFQTKQRKITSKARKLSFLYVTPCLVMFYISMSIIKIFQRVFNLQSGPEIKALSLSNITRQSEGQLHPPPQNDNGAASKFKAQTGGLQLWPWP